MFALLLPQDEKGFVRLEGKPKPGEWLWFYKETPQSLQRYQMQTRARPAPERRTFVLQPLGEIEVSRLAVLEKMREYAEIFFQVPARIQKPIPLDVPGEVLFKNVPIGNRHGKYDKQFNGDKIIDALLAKHIPEDALVYIGVTSEDLFAIGTTFVFGVASLEKRVGVYSLSRFYPEFWGIQSQPGDEITALRRACKLLNHESGHMFGITHCVFYRCSMNGSNSLSETDAAPMHYCPVCHRKLMWNLEFDAAKRYGQLEKFYRENRLTPEADFIKSRVENWKKVMEAERIQKTAEE
ncbi:MAG TPA: archaemetzincin [Planctomycetota bacterium]|nr:archaemetzincin [Planctomycetota bacterium]